MQRGARAEALLSVLCAVAHFLACNAQLPACQSSYMSNVGQLLTDAAGTVDYWFGLTNVTNVSSGWSAVVRSTASSGPKRDITS